MSEEHEVSVHKADLREARDFRILQSPDASEYLLEWKLLDGPFMTVTSIKMSREGFLLTAEGVAEVMAKIEAKRQGGE